MIRPHTEIMVDSGSCMGAAWIILDDECWNHFSSDDGLACHLAVFGGGSWVCGPSSPEDKLTPETEDSDLLELLISMASSVTSWPVGMRSQSSSFLTGAAGSATVAGSSVSFASVWCSMFTLGVIGTTPGPWNSAGLGVRQMGSTVGQYWLLGASGLNHHLLQGYNRAIHQVTGVNAVCINHGTGVPAQDPPMFSTHIRLGTPTQTCGLQTAWSQSGVIKHPKERTQHRSDLCRCKRPCTPLGIWLRCWGWHQWGPSWPSTGRLAIFRVSHHDWTQLGDPTPADDPTMGNNRLFLAADLLPLWYFVLSCTYPAPSEWSCSTCSTASVSLCRHRQYIISNKRLATMRSTRWRVLHEATLCRSWASLTDSGRACLASRFPESWMSASPQTRRLDTTWSAPSTPST